MVVDVLLDSAEGDGDEVPRLLGDGELEFDAGFRGAVRGRQLSEENRKKGREKYRMV